MGRKGFLVAMAAMLTGGCQYAYSVQAERQGDQIVLTARDGGGHFAPHACVRELEVQEIEDDGQARTIWRVEKAWRGWAVDGGKCERTDFPIVYGQGPQAMRRPCLRSLYGRTRA